MENKYMQRVKPRVTMGLGFALLFGAMMFLYLLSSQRTILVSDKGLIGQDALVPSTPLIKPQFNLVDHHGRRQSLVAFRGQWLLIYFGYTFCPDICPAALNNIADALKDMGAQAKGIQTFFITIDPARDTIHHLATYMENYPRQFLALTGTPKEIQQAMQAFHVYGQKVENPDYTEYVMDHSSIVYVVDPQGNFVASFNHETEPAKIKEILTELRP